MYNAIGDLWPGHIATFKRHAPIGAPDECWVWPHAKDRYGYGRITSRLPGARSSVSAHRVAYLLYRGDIPDGLVLDHVCFNRACVNPAHLRPVTNAENVRRRKPREVPVRCCHGHLYTEDTLIINSKGYITCRQCMREAKKKYKAARRAAA